MHKHILSQHGDGERGQTILLVALALVSLLGIAALAIDVVTLYVARSEIQRAADAAALAAAKAVADSGFTTLPTTDSHYIDGTAQLLAQGMATAAVNPMVSANAPNLVAGTVPLLVGSPIIDLTHQGNARITVNLKSGNLPTFFSKIWGRAAANVTATATAEAYNPANNPGAITPISPRSVKPWLIPNLDPASPSANTAFINAGAIEPGVTGRTFDLVSDCNGVLAPCVLLSLPWIIPGGSPPQLRYIPAQVTANPKNVCPSTCGGGSAFEESIECADANAYTYVNCGGGSSNAQWDLNVNPGGLAGASATGAECLIHAPAAGPAGQDLLVEPFPVFSNPMQIKVQTGPQSGNFVTTSNSVVTIPIFDQTTFISTSTTVTIVGYLQAFINQVEPVPTGGGVPPPAGSINITVLNIAGCSGTSNGANPVVGGAGTSPIPVRLITPP
jgi:putative Flp pilus-assembly TadE/G-like protein